MATYPEKKFQQCNGFGFDFYQDSKDTCGVINDSCNICGSTMEINDNGYEDGDISVTDISAKCTCCGYWQERKIKATPTDRSGYERSALVKKYDEKNYLDIYNIRYQDEIVVFASHIHKAKQNKDEIDYDIYFFEKSFDELEKFYKNDIQTQPGIKSTKVNGLLNKFIKGEFGLAKTFWLFYVGVAFIVALLVNFVAIPSHNPVLYNVIAFFLLFYKPVVLIALFRAISLYNGNQFWAILAKVIVVLGWGSYILSVLDFFAR